jgi:hypothetical protein
MRKKRKSEKFCKEKARLAAKKRMIREEKPVK